jgi:hypothetical protein
MGVRHALFPEPTLGAPLRGCRFPDAILHGKRSYQPRSRAVRCLATIGFRVRLFSSLRLVVAPPAYEPGQDTPAIFIRVLTTGSGSATAFDGALARCHGSDLLPLRLPFAHKPAVCFCTSPTFWNSCRPSPGLLSFPDSETLFVRLSAFLVWRVFTGKTARVLRSVLAHSSNRVPLRVTAIRPSPKPAWVT